MARVLPTSNTMSYQPLQYVSMAPSHVPAASVLEPNSYIERYLLFEATEGIYKPSPEHENVVVRMKADFVQDPHDPTALTIPEGTKLKVLGVTANRKWANVQVVSAPRLRGQVPLQLLDLHAPNIRDYSAYGAGSSKVHPHGASEIIKLRVGQRASWLPEIDARLWNGVSRRPAYFEADDFIVDYEAEPSSDSESDPEEESMLDFYYLGLRFDPATGIISGVPQRQADFRLKVRPCYRDASGRLEVGDWFHLTVQIRRSSYGTPEQESSNVMCLLLLFFALGILPAFIQKALQLTHYDLDQQPGCTDLRLLSDTPLSSTNATLVALANAGTCLILPHRWWVMCPLGLVVFLTCICYTNCINIDTYIQHCQAGMDTCIAKLTDQFSKGLWSSLSWVCNRMSWFWSLIMAIFLATPFTDTDFMVKYVKIQGVYTYVFLRAGNYTGIVAPDGCATFSDWSEVEAATSSLFGFTNIGLFCLGSLFLCVGEVLKLEVGQTYLGEHVEFPLPGCLKCLGPSFHFSLRPLLFHKAPPTVAFERVGEDKEAAAQRRDDAIAEQQQSCKLQSSYWPQLLQTFGLILWTPILFVLPNDETEGLPACVKYNQALKRAEPFMRRIDRVLSPVDESQFLFGMQMACFLIALISVGIAGLGFLFDLAFGEHVQDACIQGTLFLFQSFASCLFQNPLTILSRTPQFRGKLGGPFKHWSTTGVNSPAIGGRRLGAQKQGTLSSRVSPPGASTAAAVLAHACTGTASETSLGEAIVAGLLQDVVLNMHLFGWYERILQQVSSYFRTLATRAHRQYLCGPVPVYYLVGCLLAICLGAQYGMSLSDCNTFWKASICACVFGLTSWLMMLCPACEDEQTDRKLRPYVNFSLDMVAREEKLKAHGASGCMKLSGCGGCILCVVVFGCFLGASFQKALFTTGGYLCPQVSTTKSEWYACDAHLWKHSNVVNARVTGSTLNASQTQCIARQPSCLAVEVRGGEPTSLVVETSNSTSACNTMCERDPWTEIFYGATIVLFFTFFCIAGQCGLTRVCPQSLGFDPPRGAFEQHSPRPLARPQYIEQPSPRTVQTRGLNETSYDSPPEPYGPPPAQPRGPAATWQTHQARKKKRPQYQPTNQPSNFPRQHSYASGVSSATQLGIHGSTRNIDDYDQPAAYHTGAGVREMQYTDSSGYGNMRGRDEEPTSYSNARDPTGYGSTTRPSASAAQDYGMPTTAGYDSSYGRPNRGSDDAYAGQEPYARQSQTSASSSGAYGVSTQQTRSSSRGAYDQPPTTVYEQQARQVL